MNEEKNTEYIALLYVAFNAPHSPYMVPEDELAEHISPEEFNALVFMSGNGGVPNFEPYCTNRPLRGSKSEEFDGGVHVVFLQMLLQASDEKTGKPYGTGM